MNKKIKNVIFALIVLFLMSGCTIRPNIVVNYDGSVNEEVYVLDSTSELTKNYTLKEAVDSMAKEYKTVMDFKKYSYSYVSDKNLSGAKVYKKFDNVCSYFGNSLFNQYVYKYIDCTETDEYIEIKNATDYIPLCQDCTAIPVIDEIEYSIALPIPATEQDADEVDGNTYIWRYDKNTSDKNFYLKINKISLKKYKENYIKKENNRKKIGNFITIVIIIGVFIGLIGFIAQWLYAKSKNNKF